tara:strand:+ start:315 stop:1301 length:987 start_codon:yes stop_codon:yes gene_type:complete
MSHELEIIDGQAQMAYAGEVPWHGLGVEVSNDLSPLQMMDKAGLNWKVETKNLYYNGYTGQDVKVNSKKALVRESDGKLLDVIGSDWMPVQNEDAFNFFSEYVLAGDMEMNTAGSIREGKNIFALAKVKESFELFGGDKVDSYLLFTNPHEYGKSIDIRFTPIRVVCNNTLSMALSSESKNSIKVSHRCEFDADGVKETLGIASSKLAKYKEAAEYLGKKRYTVDSLIDYYNNVFPRTSRSGSEEYKKKDKVDQLSKNARLAYDSINLQPGAQYAEGTWWQAYNSVTFITDHIQGRNADNRLYSSWFGRNQVKKTNALKSALQFAEVA